MDRIWQHLGKLKEIQEIEERVQKTKETQLDASQPKENEKIEEDVVKPEEGIIVICEDAEEEKKKKRQKKMIEKQTGKWMQKKKRMSLHPHLQKTVVIQNKSTNSRCPRI